MHPVIAPPVPRAFTPSPGGREPPSRPRGPDEVRAVPAFPAPRAEGVGGQWADAPRNLSEARAAALRDMFPLSSSWRATPAERQRMLAAVDFVSRAESLADLNARVRRVARVFVGAR